ncbi:MAG: membrane integrity-associated transporter subunit PqiC [Deltaproteobacteria bacterium]|nr:membrane integrity-associated transporter subunit PqiC [Deltaproteobacteria bacterium]
MTQHIKPTVKLALLVTISLGATACFGTKPKNEYFYFLKAPAVAKANAKGVALSVGDFTASPGYTNQRIAYRERENELRYYAYRSWVSAPPALMAAAVVRHMLASGRFSRVDRGERIKDPLALLEGHIEAIEEIDKDNQTLAHLAMTFVLRDASSERELLRHSFDRTFPVTRRHPHDVAQAMSKLLNIELRRLADRIAQAVK